MKPESLLGIIALGCFVAALWIFHHTPAKPQTAIPAFCQVGQGTRYVDHIVKLPNQQPVLVHFYGLTDKQAETPHRFRFWLNK